MSRMWGTWRYFVSDALDAWRHSPGVNLLATATLTAVLFVAGLVLLALANVGWQLDRWREDVRVEIYLQDGVSDEQRLELTALIASTEGVARVEYVNKDEALRRFRAAFGDLSEVPALLGQNPLPASLEAFLTAGGDGAATARALAAALAGRPGVEEVRFDRAALDRLDSMLRLAKTGGAGIAVVVLAAVAFVMAGVLKLSVYARRDEIEIMLLVGASPGFVRGPFLVAGMLQGLVASLVSLVLVEGARRLALGSPASGEGALLDLLAGRPLSLELSGGVLAAGVTVGLLGAWLAARGGTEDRGPSAPRRAR